MIRFWLAVLILCASFGTAGAATFTGTVVGVIDGDTIDVLTPEKKLSRVRLAGIDTPERRQAFGSVAKSELSKLAFQQPVIINYSKMDRYGRIVGIAMVDRVDVGLELVRRGLAWHYKKYEAEQSKSDRLAYASAEIAARAQSRGLWIDPVRIPPWEFRATKRG